LPAFGAAPLGVLPPAGALPFFISRVSGFKPAVVFTEVQGLTLRPPHVFPACPAIARFHASSPSVVFAARSPAFLPEPHAVVVIAAADGPLIVFLPRRLLSSPILTLIISGHLFVSYVLGGMSVDPETAAFFLPQLC
jgi:hypothetical protein